MSKGLIYLGILGIIVFNTGKQEAVSVYCTTIKVLIMWTIQFSRQITFPLTYLLILFDKIIPQIL